MRILIVLLLFLPIVLKSQWQPNGVVVCDTTGEQFLSSKIIKDGEGGVYVIWGDHRYGWNIYMQHIDSSGYMLWGRQGKPLCIKPGYQFSPFVVADGEGGFVVVWHDYRNSFEDWRYDRDVYAQRVDKYGNKLWGDEDLLICKELYYQGVSGITMTSDSCFIIVWDDDRDYPEGNGSIYVQKIDKMGNLLWDRSGVRVAENWGDRTRIVSDMNGGCLIIF